MALARAGEGEGLWLAADRQTGGRGRQGRAWDSPPGNLHASTLVRLRPGDPPAASLAFVASLALHEAVRPYLDDPGCLMLKWPNDLLCGGAKLSGILLERGEDAVVVGIGVNLAHHPALPDRPATSLAAHGTAPAPGIFVRDLAEAFALWLGRWRELGLGAILDAWLDRAHPAGTPLSVHDGAGDRISGTFDGLDAEGALRLRLADGARRVIHAGDVFLI